MRRGYIAIVLDRKSRTELLNRLPPIFPKVYAHHVTLAFQPSRDEYATWRGLIGRDTKVVVTGSAHDGLAQAAVVSLDVRCSNRTPHITVSTNHAPPKTSNAMLASAPIVPCSFELRGVISFVPA